MHVDLSQLVVWLFSCDGENKSWAAAGTMPPLSTCHLCLPPGKRLSYLNILHPQSVQLEQCWTTLGRNRKESLFFLSHLYSHHVIKKLLLQPHCLLFGAHIFLVWIMLLSFPKDIFLNNTMRKHHFPAEGFIWYSGGLNMGNINVFWQRWNSTPTRQFWSSWCYRREEAVLIKTNELHVLSV